MLVIHTNTVFHVHTHRDGKEKKRKDLFSYANFFDPLRSTLFDCLLATGATASA